MTAAPGTHTFADGLATSSEMNTYVRDPLNFLLNPPIAELKQIVTQNLTSAVAAAITFTSSDFDTVNGHSNSVNTSRYTAVYPGVYQFSGGVSIAASAVGVRQTVWRKNGLVINGSAVLISASSAFGTSVPARTIQVALLVGDYVELYAFQNSGGLLATEASAETASHMSVRQVSN